MACQAREAKRKFKISDKGSEAIIWIKSSLGRARNSWSNEALDVRELRYPKRGIHDCKRRQGITDVLGFGESVDTLRRSCSTELREEDKMDRKLKLGRRLSTDLRGSWMAWMAWMAWSEDLGLPIGNMKVEVEDCWATAGPTAGPSCWWRPASSGWDLDSLSCLSLSK